MKHGKLLVVSTLALTALFASLAQADLPGEEPALSALEAALSFDGVISAKAGPSAHTSTYLVQVGDLEHPYGKGFVLAFRERIPDGACTIDKVFDFATGNLLVTDRYGNPGCGDIVAEPRVLTAADPAYQSELVSLLAILHRMVEGSYHPTGKPEPALAPAVRYLDELVAALP